jgi:lysophospholipase L1-like esterase
VKNHLPFYICAFLLPQLFHLSAADQILPAAKRVVFLGDSITYSGEYVELIEAYFTTHCPQRQIEFLNLGLPSETVSGLSEDGHAGGSFPRPDLHERLARVLEKTRPDIVIACYGMNDGIYLPFADERFAAFTNGILRLRQAVISSGAKIIHVTPPVFDEARGKGPGYARTLDRYSDWLLTQRAAGWDVVDLHRPMDTFLKERRKTDPAFYLADDGVHAGELGHWIIAKQILLHLGARDLDKTESPSDMLRPYPHSPELLALIKKKHHLLKDAWLTSTGHKRPGMNKGLPLEQAQAQAARIDEKIRPLAN